MKWLIELIVLFQITHGIRILGIFPHVGKSHYRTFQKLMTELAYRGHEVTVISHFPAQEPIKNYKDISLAGSIPIWQDKFTFDNFSNFGIFAKIVRHTSIMKVMIESSETNCEALLKNPTVRGLKEGQFDVAITEQFNSDCALGLVYKLKAKLIGVTSHILMPYTRSKIGIVDHPAFVSNLFLGFGSRPNLWQTIETFMVNIYYKSVYYDVQRLEHRILTKYLGGSIPPLHEISKNMDLLLISTYFSLTGAQLLPPNVVEVGGFQLQNEEINLPEDLKKFLDESTQGVIIFSMGSMLRATSWPQEKLRAFQEAFSALPQKVLWKWENDTMENAPGNVRIQKWIPQFSALRHPNVKGFIGHGGLGGMMEATHVGVPVLAIPMFGDQFCNSQSAKESGLAVVLDYYNISKESVAWGIGELLTPRMQKRAKEVSAEWNDRPMSPMDTAIYWIEHVARHGGHLMRSPSVHVSWIRYYLLDVFAVFLLIDLAVIYIVYRMFKFCCRKKGGKKPKKD